MLDLTTEDIKNRFLDKYNPKGSNFAEDLEIFKSMMEVHEAVSIIELLQLMEAPSDMIELVTDHLKIKMIGLCPDAVENLERK